MSLTQKDINKYSHLYENMKNPAFRLKLRTQLSAKEYDKADKVYEHLKSNLAPIAALRDGKIGNKKKDDYLYKEGSTSLLDGIQDNQKQPNLLTNLPRAAGEGALRGLSGLAETGSAVTDYFVGDKSYDEMVAGDEFSLGQATGRAASTTFDYLADELKRASEGMGARHTVNVEDANFTSLDGIKNAATMVAEDLPPALGEMYLGGKGLKSLAVLGASIFGNTAAENAQNKGEDRTTFRALADSAPYSAGSVAAQIVSSRLGGGGQGLAGAARSIGVGSASEGTQEGLQYLGGINNTNKEYNEQEMINSIKAGAIVGGAADAGFHLGGRLVEGRSNNQANQVTDTTGNIDGGDGSGGLTGTNTANTPNTPPPSTSGFLPNDIIARVGNLDDRLATDIVNMQTTLSNPDLDPESRAAVQARYDKAISDNGLTDFLVQPQVEQTTTTSSDAATQPTVNEAPNNLLTPTEQTTLADEAIATTTASDTTFTPLPEVEANEQIGKDSYVRISKKKTPTTLKVVEAGSLTPELQVNDSDNESANQNRDRTTAAAMLQVNDIANDIEPRELEDTANLQSGSPVLARDGQTIIAGNGRTMAVQKAYQIGTANEYKQHLINNAEAYGLDPNQVAQMENPILVRQLQDDVDIRQAALASNTEGTMGIPAVDQAGMDINYLPDLSEIVTDDTGNVNTASNRGAIQKFVSAAPREQQAAMVTPDGMLSQEGERRFVNAILYKAYGRSPALADMIEATDPDLKNALNALVKSAPKIAATKDAISKGILTDADISQNITEALARLQQLRFEGVSVEEFIASVDMFDELSPVTRDLVAYMDENIRSAKAITQLLTAYYDNVNQYGNEQAGAFDFGDGANIDTDPESLLQTTLEEVRNARQQLKRGQAKRADNQQVPAEASRGAGSTRVDETAAASPTANATTATAAVNTRASRTSEPVNAGDATRESGTADTDSAVRAATTAANDAADAARSAARAADKAAEATSSAATGRSATETTTRGQQRPNQVQSNAESTPASESTVNQQASRTGGDTAVDGWNDIAQRILDNTNKNFRRSLANPEAESSTQQGEQDTGNAVDTFDTDISSLVDFVEGQDAQLAGVNGYYDRDADKTVVMVDHINPVVVDGEVVLTKDENVRWVTWHELFHRGMNVIDSTEYQQSLSEAGTNDFVQQLADKINENYGVDEDIAIEEAMSEIHAALKTGSLDVLAKKYGIKVPPINGIRTVINKWVQTLRNIINKIAGRDVKLTDSDLVDMVTRIGEQGLADTKAGGQTKARAEQNQFSSIDPPETQLEAVRTQYEGTDQWLKAPNGEDTHLTESQWLQVRTPAFKQWFGDWENNRDNASKVVHPNGEPMVVYHYTEEEFFKFDVSKARQSTDLPALFFAANPEMGMEYGDNEMQVFLNIRNPSNKPSITTEKDGRKLRDELIDQGYDGTIVDDSYDDYIDIEYAAFNPNQVKSATDNTGAFSSRNDDIRYSSSKENEPRNLYIAHGLSADNIIAASELGGLAAPSIAVARADVSNFDNYGEITLLADPSFLDGQTTYDADIYSPRQPRASYEIDERAFNDFESGLETFDNNLTFPNYHSLNNSIDADQFVYSDAVKYQFLKTIGKDPKIKNAKVEPIVKKLSKVIESGVDRYNFSDNDKVMGIITKHFDAKAKQIAEKYADGDAVTAEDYEFARSIYFDDDGSVKRDAADRLFVEAESFKKSGSKDYFQLRQDINTRIRQPAIQSAYKDWANKQFNSIVKSKNLKVETQSGGWKYVPYNMNNVVKEMTKELQMGEQSFYGAGSVRSVLANRMDDIKDIQERRDQIISKEDFEVIRDEANDKFAEVLDALKPYYKYGSDDLSYGDNAGYAIAKGDKEFNKSFKKVPPSVKKVVDDFKVYLGSLPTEYFESKMQRPVAFSEFQTAVIPKNLKGKAVDILRDAGVTIRRYDPNVEGDRQRIIAKQKNILFSRNQGKAGAPDEVNNRTGQDVENARAAIESALGKAVANSITIQKDSSSEMAGVEGYHNRTTGETVILLDNIEPMYDADGNVVMTREERAVWVAWHESYHKGTSVAGNAAYRKTLAIARRNPFINALAEKIQLANPDYSFDVATEEALAELSAGLNTGRLDVIAKQYGIATPQYEGVRAIVKKWIAEVRNILRRLMGKQLTVSDVQIADMVRNVGQLAVDNAVSNKVSNEVSVDGETANLYSLNEAKDSDFAKAVDDLYNNDKKRVSSKWIELGTTPEALTSSGINEGKMIINQAKMAKIKNDHPEITASMMKRIPIELNNPVAVFKNTKRGSVENSYVVLTEMQADNGNIVIIPLHAYQSQGGLVVHKVASMYGRNESAKYIENMVNHAEVRYADEQKARRVQRRLQLLEANTVDELFDKAIVLKSDIDVNEDSAEKNLSQYKQPRSESSNSSEINTERHDIDSEVEADPTRFSRRPSPPPISTTQDNIIDKVRRGEIVKAVEQFFAESNLGVNIHDKVFDSMGELERIAKKYGGLAKTVHQEFRTVAAKTQEELRANVEPRVLVIKNKLVAKQKELMESKPEYKGQNGGALLLHRLDEIGKYYFHGKERNLTVLINSGGEDAAGSGKTNAEIDALIADYDANHPELIDFYRELYRDDIRPLIDYKTDKLLESGLLTQEQVDAQYDWEWYVPLKGEGRESEIDPVTGKIIDDKLSNNQPVNFKQFNPFNKLGNKDTPAMKGRHGTEAENIFQSIFTDAQIAVQRSFMQAPKKALLDYVQTPEGAEAYEAKSARKIDSKQFKVDQDGNLFIVPPDLEVKENTVVYRDGNEVWLIEVGNGRAANAMLNLTNAFGDGTWGSVGRGFSKVTRMNSSVWTRFNIGFQIFNKIRDAKQHYVTLLADAPIGDKADSYFFGDNSAAKNLSRRFKLANEVIALNAKYTTSLATIVTGKPSESALEYKQYLQMLRELGGVTTYSDLLSGDVLANIEREIQKSLGGASALPKKTQDALVKFFDGVGDNIELTSRVAMFKALLDEGVDPQDAALYVKNTMNFETKGDWGRLMGSIWAFAPSIIFDVKRTSQALFTSKEGHLVFGSLVMFKLMTMAVADAIGEEDEDGIPFIDKVPFYQAQGYDTLILGERGEGFKVPHGWGISRAASGTAVIMRRLAKGTMTVPEAAEHFIMDVVMSNFSPIQIKSVEGDFLGRMLQTFVPTVLLPMIQADSNTSFTGNSIYKDDAFRRKGYLNYESGYEWTEDTYKVAAKLLHDGSLGAVDLHPEIIKLYAQSYIPMSAEGVMITESIIDGVQGNTDTRITGANIPIASKFLSFPPRYDQAKYSQTRKKLLEDQDKMLSYERNGNEEKAQKYRDLEVSRWVKKTQVITKSVKKLNAKAEAYKDKYEGDELIEKLREVEDEERRLKMKFNQEWREWQEEVKQ